jgi:HSP20 family protein
MAETSVQTKEKARDTAEQRGIERRHESYGRDLFGLSPFSMMRRLSEEMDRAFSRSFGFPRWNEPGMWAPPIEVRERNNNLEIVAELPGLTKDDVKVEFTDEGLVIEGEKRRERETEEGGYHRSELSFGRFYRMVPLPESADPDKAKAEFKNGVLTVQLPVSERHHKTRQIPINS